MFGLGSIMIGAESVQAGPIWDWLTGKNNQPSGTCCAKPPCGTYPNAYYPQTAPGTIVYPPGVVPPPLPGTTLPPGALPPTTTRYPTQAAVNAYYPPPSAYAMNGLPRTTYYGGTIAQTVAMQPVAMQPVAQPPVAQPGAWQPAPGMVAAPGTAAAGCPTCQQPVRLNYAPYANYTTSWLQIPVTTYRPISAIDPATGMPVTVIQPYTTTTGQWQRRPALVQRPILSMFQPVPVTAYSQPLAVQPTAPVAAPTMNWAPPANCPNCQYYGTPPVTYGMPATAGWGTTLPAGSYPATTYGTPTYGTPGGGSSLGGISGGEPASQQPSLPAGTYPPTSSTNYPPTDSYPSSGSGSSGFNNGSSSIPATSPRQELRVKPIPDLETEPPTTESEPGKLIVPRERTASRAVPASSRATGSGTRPTPTSLREEISTTTATVRPASGINAVQPSTPTTFKPQAPVKALPTPPKGKLDESGWRSL